MKNFEKYRPGYFTPPMDISQMEWPKKDQKRRCGAALTYAMETRRWSFP